MLKVIYNLIIDFKNISKKYNELFKRYEEKSNEVKVLKEKHGEIDLKNNLSSKNIFTEIENSGIQENFEENENNKSRMIKSII